jgi:hypothetical protein
MEMTNNSYVATLKLASKISSCCSWLSFYQVVQSLNIYRLRSPRMFMVFKVVVAKANQSLQVVVESDPLPTTLQMLQ